jgi:hypothetical protein
MAGTRREFLAAAGVTAVVAGCSARAPHGEPEYRLSVRVVESAADPMAYTATVLRETATLGEPMVLRSTFENPGGGEETEESTMPRSPTVFSRDSGVPGDAPDIALMDPDTGYDQRHPGCWTPDVDSITVLLGKLDLSDLPQGTTVHIDHAVWQNPRAPDDPEQCLQPGTYAVPLRFGLGVELEVAVEAP